MKLDNFLSKILVVCFLGLLANVKAYNQTTIEVEFFKNPGDRELRDKIMELRSLAKDEVKTILKEMYKGNISIPPDFIEDDISLRKNIKIKYSGKAKIFVFGEIKKKGSEFKINLYIYQQTGDTDNGIISIEQKGESIVYDAYSIDKWINDSKFRYDFIKRRVEELPLSSSGHSESPKPSGNYIKIRGTRGNTFFPMGSDRRSDGKKRLSEEKIHFVQVYDFEIGRNEVTNLEFCEFLNDTALIRLLEEEDLSIRDLADFVQSGIYITLANKYAPRPLRPNEPVIMVSWDGARLYAKWLSQKTGKIYRLPTEVEWEYAASMTQYQDGRWDNTMFRYSGGNKIKDVAWYQGNSQQKVHAIGEHLRDNNGIYNMTGNVAEWCLDDYKDNDYARFSRLKKDLRKSNEPIRHRGARQKIVRGGSYKSQKHYCRNAYRGHRIADTTGKYDDVGFRLVRVKK